MEQLTAAPPTGMAALRAGTTTAHLRAERALDASSWLDSPGDYARFLVRLLRFHEQVEVALPADLHHPAPRRSLLIRADLACLPLPLPLPAPAPPPPAAPAAAVGSQYVVQGSALGGQVLLRRITARLGYDAARGASCFLPYGLHARRQWRAFGAAVDAWTAAHPEHLSATVAAARSCFATYERVVVRP